MRLVVTLLILINLSGCSSLANSPANRNETIATYLTQPQPLVLYDDSELQVDEQLQVLGLKNLLTPLIEHFHSTLATRGIVEQFIAATPLAQQNVKLVAAEEWSSLDLAPQTPVLFVHANWKMSYQRLPPQFRNQRLQVGTIAKIVPLGQVLAGKGTIALHTAAWEARCRYEPFDGRYLSIDEWLAVDGEKLQQATKESQQACGKQLAVSFPAVPVMGTRAQAGYN